MSRFAIYFRRMLLMLAAFMIACLAASAFLHLLWFGPSIAALDPAERPPAAPLYFSIPFLAMLVGHYGFFQALVVLAVAELWEWRNWLFYALAGAVAALPVLAGVAQQSGTLSFHAATLIGAGLVAGIAYWLVAGRTAGLWRERAIARRAS